MEKMYSEIVKRLNREIGKFEYLVSVRDTQMYNVADILEILMKINDGESKDQDR